MTKHKLTPAGEQVERALEQGYAVAACNLYVSNMRDDVPMVEGDDPTTGASVSVWPEWHQKIQTATGFHDTPLLGQELAEAEADEQGLTGDLREEYIDERMQEIAEFEPSIVEERIRNELGEILGEKFAPNPQLDR